MKCLLVFVVALAVASAQEVKVEEKKAEAVVPLTYAFPGYAYPTAYSTPLVYNYQPVVQKLVPKEYEVEVKSYQIELAETGCKNSFGNPVPCAGKAKRSPQEEVAADAAPAEEAKPAEEPKPAEEAAPAAEAKSVEEAKPAEAAAVVPAANLLPYYYTNAYAAPVVAPLTYTYPYAAPFAYKALEPKVQEIEVPTPKFKSVVEKIPIQPLCQNMYGFAVPCAK